MSERIEQHSRVDAAAEQRRTGPLGRAGADPTRRAKAARTRVLVAAPPMGEAPTCLPGELVWLPPGCGRVGCACLRRFAGCCTQGFTPRARVIDLVGVGRSAVHAALRAGMCPHCVAPAAAERSAERLLLIAAAHPVGALLERGPRGGIVLAGAGWTP